VQKPGDFWLLLLHGIPVRSLGLRNLARRRLLLLLLLKPWWTDR